MVPCLEYPFKGISRLRVCQVYSEDCWGSKWKKGFLEAGKIEHIYLIIIVALTPLASSLLKTNA